MATKEQRKETLIQIEAEDELMATSHIVDGDRLLELNELNDLWNDIDRALVHRQRSEISD